MFTSYRVMGALLLFSMEAQVPALNNSLLTISTSKLPVHVLVPDHLNTTAPPESFRPVSGSSDTTECPARNRVNGCLRF